MDAIEFIRMYELYINEIGSVIKFELLPILEGLIKLIPTT